MTEGVAKDQHNQKVRKRRSLEEKQHSEEHSKESGMKQMLAKSPEAKLLAMMSHSVDACIRPFKVSELLEDVENGSSQDEENVYLSIP